MGKAYKPPETNRQLRYHITMHAVERFRERVEEEFRHRSDHDLARLLDERAEIAIRAGNCFIVVDSEKPNEDTTVAKIESRHGQVSYAVMRKHNVTFRDRMMSGGPDVNGLAIITVLTEAQGQGRISNGIWHIPHRPMADQLRNVQVKPKLEVVTAEATKEIEIKDVKVEPVKVEPEKPMSPVAALPHGWKDRHEREKRRAWIRQRYMEAPLTPIKHMIEYTRERFGVGVQFAEVSEIKEEVQAFIEKEAAGFKPVEVVAAPAPAPAPVVDNTATIAAEYAKAVHDEKLARSRADELSKAAADAAADALKAKQRTDDLLRQLTEARA